ncbi:MAG: hypothetical protein IMZ67_08760 [Acidobacteria bacterium]|nr:hypothetical protein [Acidobacteriota bacterium]
MYWFFERNGQRMRWEIRRDADRAGYELVLTPPDGPEATERFTDPTALIERTLVLQQSLLDEGWRSLHAPRDPADPADPGER